MKEILGTLWFMIMAPFYKDFWEDEEAFAAYFGCIFGSIFLVMWFAVLGLFIYGLYLVVLCLEALI